LSGELKTVIDLGKGKILVTGGAGFIGSALVWALNCRSFDNILVCDELATDEKWRNLIPLRFDDYIAAADLLELVRSQRPVLDDIGTVFHLGACSATTERDLGYLMRNNYQFTRDLAEWAVRHRLRFVYASSAATYGDGSAGMSDDSERLEQLRPLNGYAFSKHRFDLYAKRRGLLEFIVGLKYFNVFGPNEGHKKEMRSVVHKAFEQVLEIGKIQLFKSYRPEYRDGEQQRDFLYVKDAVEMTLFLATQLPARGLFNLGSGKARTWNELASAIFAALNKPPKIEYVEMPEGLRDKYQYFTEANIEKLRSLGYPSPAFTLEQGVADYVQNHLLPQKPLEPTTQDLP
jgi:ADP-L-glycero-D-manno-heptose 6-epimerase